MKTFITILLAAIIAGLGLYPSVAPYWAKPYDRIYTLREGFIDDYVGYVSYIKEGMYGRGTVAIRSLPKAGQSPTSVHMVYILGGKIAGVAQVSAPAAYHAIRGLVSFFLVLAIVTLLTRAYGSWPKAMVTTVLASMGSYLGWYRWDGSAWVYDKLSYFGFTDTLALRLVSRPHYDFGALLFVSVILILISGGGRRVPQKLMLVCLTFLLGITHPSFGVILAGTLGLTIVYFGVYPVLFCLFGLGVGLGLSYWSVHQYPYTAILAFESMVTGDRYTLLRMWRDAVSFGPIFWLGIPGLLIRVFKRQGTHAVHYVFLLWIVVQFVLYFALYPLFRAQNFRFIQSLYFIPLAYGTGVLVEVTLPRRIKRAWSAVMIGLCLLFIPTYIYGWKQKLYENTDYRSFDRSVFPTADMMESYRFLDTGTPRESVVLSGQTAGNHILLFSHNFVIGNAQGWPSGERERMEGERDGFFSGKWGNSQARSFLDRYGIGFVYRGYEEERLGDISRYPFLVPVFYNTQVRIYNVR